MERGYYEQCHSYDTEIVEIMTLLEFRIADIAHDAEIYEQD